MFPSAAKNKPLAKNEYFNGPVQIQLIRSVLSRSFRASFTVTGPSMSPTIKSGDSIEIYRCDEKPRVGKIYAFEQEDSRIYVHRLIKIHKTTDQKLFIFKGDGLTCYDPPVSYEKILGKVTSIEGAKENFFFGIFQDLPFGGIFLAFYFRLRPWVSIYCRQLTKMIADFI